MKTLKAMVFLMFLIGLGFLFFSLKTVSTINSQNEVIDQLKGGVAEQGDTVVSMSKAVEASRERATLLGKEKQQLSDDLSEKETALSETEQAKNEAEEAMAEITTAKDEVVKDLETAQSQVADLKTETASKQQVIDKMADEMKNMAAAFQAERESAELLKAAQADDKMTKKSKKPDGSAEIAKLKKSHAREIADIQKDHEGDIAKLNKKHEKAMSSAGKTVSAPASSTKDNSAEIAKLEKKHDKVMDALTDSHAKSIGKVQKELDATKKQVAKLKAQGAVGPRRKKSVKAGAAGKVTAVKTLGVITVGFEGLVSLKESDICKVVRSGEKLGNISVDDIYYTVFILQQSTPGVEEVVLQKDDEIVIMK